MDEYQNAMEELHDIVEGISKLRDAAYTHYSLLVEQVLKDRITDEQQLERIMDGLCDFCDEIRFIELYRSLCRHIYYQYPQLVGEHGKPIPSNAIKCQENADPVTGHLPCWVPCDRTATGDKWFWDAYDRMGIVPNGTYEAIGPHFRANPYNLDADVLKPHGKDIVELDRSFEGIRTYLETHVIEGIVFWKDGHPRCKIKRKDFGFPWGR